MCDRISKKRYFTRLETPLQLYFKNAQSRLYTIFHQFLRVVIYSHLMNLKFQ